MNNEKRLFIFLILTLGVLFFSQSFFSQRPVEQPVTNQPLIKEAPDDTRTSEQEEHNTLQRNSLEEVDILTPLPFEEMKAVQVGSYILKISAQSGIVRSFELKEYPGEELAYRNLFLVPQFQGLEFSLKHIEDGIELINRENGIEIRIEAQPEKPYLLAVSVQSDEPLRRIQLFSQAEDAGTRFASRYQEVVYKTDTVSRIPWAKVDQKLLTQSLGFVGARDKHFAMVLLSPPKGQYLFKRQGQKGAKAVGLIWEPEGTTGSFSGQVYIGPQKSEILRQYGLDQLIYYGFFHFFAVIILKILFFFHGVFHNWGVSIIALSVLIYFILFPLTAKSTKSMRRIQEQMKDIQPKVNAVKEKYKDNPQKMNKEMMELYRKNNVNPLGSLGGCLPMLLQIPIFVALYQVLNRLVEIKGANFLWIDDLSRPDYLIKLPFSQPFDGIHLLPLIMVGIMVLQQKFTTPQTQSSEQQKMMSIMFPIIFGVIFYTFSSGLVLYWLCNSTFTFLYQLRLSKAKSK